MWLVEAYFEREASASCFIIIVLSVYVVVLRILLSWSLLLSFRCLFMSCLFVSNHDFLCWSSPVFRIFIRHNMLGNFVYV